IMIKKGLILMYKIICWGIDQLWGYNTREIMNAILANMDMHDALIRQIKFGQGGGDPFSITSIPVGIRLMAFVVINLVIVFVVAKFETLSNVLRMVNVSREKLASGLSSTAGGYASRGELTVADWMGDLINMVTMFTGGGQTDTSPPKPSAAMNAPFGTMPQQQYYGPPPPQ